MTSLPTIIEDRDAFDDPKLRFPIKTREFIDDNSAFVFALRYAYSAIAPYIKSKIQEFKDIITFSNRGLGFFLDLE